MLTRAVILFFIDIKHYMAEFETFVILKLHIAGYFSAMGLLLSAAKLGFAKILLAQLVIHFCSKMNDVGFKAIILKFDIFNRLVLSHFNTT